MKRFILKTLLWFILILIICSYILICVGLIKYIKAIKKTSLYDKVEEIRNSENYTKLDDISDDYKNAVIAVEDHRFYNHKGVDYLSLFHSTFVNIKSKSLDYGASTITQQVRKNAILLSRKICHKKNCRNICSL